jgi:hypothetical protein
LGLKNNWINKKNVIDYAVNLLENGDNNINIISISTGTMLPPGPLVGMSNLVASPA